MVTHVSTILSTEAHVSSVTVMDMQRHVTLSQENVAHVNITLEEKIVKCVPQVEINIE